MFGVCIVDPRHAAFDVKRSAVRAARRLARAFKIQHSPFRVAYAGYHPAVAKTKPARLPFPSAALACVFGAFNLSFVSFQSSVFNNTDNTYKSHGYHVIVLLPALAMTEPVSDTRTFTHNAYL